MIVDKQFIADLRGGIPEKCSWCDQPMTPEEAEPEEGGEWICRKCFDRDMELYGPHGTAGGET